MLVETRIEILKGGKILLRSCAVATSEQKVSGRRKNRNVALHSGSLYASTQKVYRALKMSESGMKHKSKGHTNVEKTYHTLSLYFGNNMNSYSYVLVE